jgi:hypothetical protein
MVHVPYRTLGAAFTDLFAGHVSMVMATPVELKSYLDSGKIRPLAVTATTRSKQLPGVPTVAETLPSPPSITLNGLVAPGRTPQEIVDTLAREIIAAEKTRIPGAPGAARRRPDRRNARRVRRDHCHRHRALARHRARARPQAALTGMPADRGMS